jgi:hypothetical protein
MGGHGADGCDGRGDVCHDVSGESGGRPTIMGRLGRPGCAVMISGPREIVGVGVVLAVAL